MYIEETRCWVTFFFFLFFYMTDVFAVIQSHYSNQLILSNLQWMETEEKNEVK